MDSSFDGEAARKESLSRLPGLADHFEKEDPAMHKTNTVDYAVVYEGEIWLELDDGKQTAFGYNNQVPVLFRAVD